MESRMKAKQHSPVNPMGVSCKGEYCSDKLEMNGRSAKPKAGSSAKASMHDGPYGGKKPQG